MDSNKFPAWDKIGAQLSPPVLSFVTERLKHKGAAPVQATVIPLICKGKDCVVEAITGSGKTLAFLIPAAELLLTARVRDICAGNRHSVVVLCIFPTRELANQVHNIAKDFIQHINKVLLLQQQQQQQQQQLSLQPSGGKKKGGAAALPPLPNYSEACFVGGHAVAKDLVAFQDKGAHLLLGTPGRLNELLVTSKESVCFDLRNLEMLILDEADRLLECGFRATLDSLLRRLPKQRRTALFSATQSRELADLARAGTRNPLLVTVKENPHAAAPAAQNQRAVPVNDDDDDDAATAQQEGAMKAQVPTRLVNRYQITRYCDKLDALVAYLRPVVHDCKILIYVITCASAEWLHAALQVLLGPAGEDASSVAPPLFALHGQLGMEQRKKVHKAASQAGKAATIICSDVAARGLDLPNVRHVVQFDAPTDPRTFVHRIGRTARMGQPGDSLLLLAPLERDYVNFIEMQNVTLVEHNPKQWARDRNGASSSSRKGGNDEDDNENDDENDKDENDDTADDDADNSKSMFRVDKRRTMQSTMAERLKLKAARGRSASLAKRRRAMKDKHRVVITSGDLCQSPSILALRRAVTIGNNTALMQKAARAFVSFIRAYKEHECRNIFRLQYIDITDLTNGFALFFVPNCGEIRMMNTLRIPLQEEFAGFVTQLDKERKQAQSARFAAATAAAEARESEEQLNAPDPRSNNNKRRSGGDDDDDDENGNDDEDGDEGDAAITGGQQRRKTVHELTSREKQRVRESNMSQKQKSRAWKAIDQSELFRDYHLVKKENQGKLSESRVDELLGLNSMDNAHMSSRERKQRRRTRSQ